MLNTDHVPAFIANASDPRVVEWWNHVANLTIEVARMEDTVGDHDNELRLLRHQQVAAYERLLGRLGIELWSDEDLDMLDHLACLTVITAEADAAEPAA